MSDFLTLTLLVAYLMWGKSSLIPRLSRNANCTCVGSTVSFLCKYDVIEIGLKQKGNVLHVDQPTMCSTLSVYDIQPPITRYM